jgi:hypothetical protein
MGTQDQAAWQRKVERYTSFFPDTLHDYFAIDVATLAVITTAEVARVAKLTRWTEQALTRLGKKEELGDLFFFGQTSADTTPEELYLSPRFRAAFHPTIPTYPLLEGDLTLSISASGA